MYIYKDICSSSDDEELLSDGYKIKLVDDIIYEVDCAMVEESGVSVDIGANPSAEDAEEELADEGGKKVNNVVSTFRLQPTQFDKKSYGVYLKGYLKKLTEKMKERGSSSDDVKAWQTKALAKFKEINSKFDDWEFFTGPGMDPDGMVVLLNYREDGVTPYLVYWKDGLNQIKV